MPFKHLLAQHTQYLRLVMLVPLVACGSEKAACEGTFSSPNYELVEGYVTVPTGTECPDPSTLESLDTIDCCPSYMFIGPICGASRVVTNQEKVTSEYQGIYFQDATADTVDPVDLCFYEAVFDNTGACCGRPLLQDGEPQVAQTRLCAESPPICEQSGQYWMNAALLEHASMASFARCTLELMKWGAPLPLLRATQQAGLDEADHAERTLRLAGRLLGSAVVPGVIQLGDAVSLSATRADFAEAVLREGAIGETLAVLDAVARLGNVRDGEVRAVLEVIIKDESEHAALAWGILRWLIQEDVSVKERLVQVFAEEQARVMESVGVRSVSPKGFGLIDDVTQKRVFAEGFVRVLEPAFAELVG